MNDAPRQTLRALVARHGPGLCSDARRCEGLLRDLSGAHRREVNILVSALKERVPLDLLAAQSAMPRGLLVARLAKRLEDQLALTEEAARWAVDSWALALGVVTEAEVAEREEKAERAKKAAPPPPSTSTSSGAPRPVFEKDADEAKSRATQTQTPRPASPPPPQRQQPVTPPPSRATTPAPQPTPPPTVARTPGRQSPPAPSPKTSWPPPPPWGRTWFPVRRHPAAAQANTKTPQGGALPFPAQTQAQDPSPRGKRRTLRGCTVGCLLLVVLALALFVGGPFVLSVLREEQQRRNLEPSPVLSP